LKITVARFSEMLATLQHNFVLWVKVKTGLTASFVIFLIIAGLAAVMSFVFLCVTGCAWATVKLDPVFGSRANAGAFLLIGALAAAAAVLTRRHTRQRAALERAARVQGVSAPRVLSRGEQGWPANRLRRAVMTEARYWSIALVYLLA
jgi:hypothetical protein